MGIVIEGQVVLPGTAIAHNHSLELIKDKDGNNKELLWWHLAFEPMARHSDLVEKGDPCFAVANEHEFSYWDREALQAQRNIELDEIEEDKLKTLWLSPSISCIMCGRHIFIDPEDILACSDHANDELDRYLDDIV